ncbi:MAG: transposase [Geminicoccaceae bacterium]
MLSRVGASGKPGAVQFVTLPRHATPKKVTSGQRLRRVERLWARLKEWRAVATRYEKTARSFMGVVCLAATLDWLKP